MTLHVILISTTLSWAYYLRAGTDLITVLSQMMYNPSSSLLLKIIIINILAQADTRIVNTRNGPIKGFLNIWKNITYYSFLGIPYAESPSGPLRFKPPVPKRTWTHVLDATHEKPVCPQGIGKYPRYKMNEDCLFLNIHVPTNVNQNEHRLPVLVFVHGGAFRYLSGNSDILYGPQLFLEQGIIFVSMNYRLGALGFLSLDVDEAPGNAAIKDVILALKWIYNSIEQFGGDRNKITVGGHSSGSAMIHCILMSKQSVNLFQQVIMISGNTANPRSFATHAKDNAFKLAKELRLQTNDVQTLLKKLKELNVFEIIDAEMNLTKYDDVVLRPFSLFTPTIEIETSHAIITSNTDDLWLLPNISIFTGFNYREGIYTIPKIRRDTRLLKKLKDNMELSIPSNIEYPLKSKHSLDLANSIREFYFKSDFSNFTLNNIVDLASDSQYIYGTDSWINKYKKRNNSNDLYYYVFDFDGDLNWAKIENNIDFPGTAHADELGYLFVTKNTIPILNQINDKSRIVMETFVTLISNFIKFGNPTPEDFISDFKWPEYGDKGTLLFINENPVTGVLTNPLLDRLKFWYNVYEVYDNYVKDGGVLAKKCIP